MEFPFQREIYSNYHPDVSGYIGQQPVLTVSRGGRRSVYDLDPHFIFPDNIKEYRGLYKATCKHCSSPISASTSCKSNLITHLRLRHKILPLSNSLGPNTDADSALPPVDPEIVCGLAVSVDTKPVINWPRNESSSSRTSADAASALHWHEQAVATEAYVNWLAMDFRPLDTAESPMFKVFINSLRTRWIPPTAEKAEEYVQQKVEQIRAYITSALSEVDSVSLSLVYKPINQQGCVVVAACHYVTETFVHCTAIIGSERFHGTTNSKDMKAFVQSLEKEWHLEDKIGAILVTNVDLHQQIVNYSMLDFNGVTNSQPTANGGRTATLEETDPLFSELPNLRPGFTEQLQKNLQQVLIHSPPNTRHALEKAGQLLQRQEHLDQLTEETSELDIKWMRQLASLKSLLRDKANVNMENMSTDEQAALEECVAVLGVFENFMVLLEEQPTATTGLIIPCLCEIHQSLTDMDITHTKELVGTLLHTIKELLDYYRQFTDFQYSCILDPRFKSSLVDSQAVISLQKEGCAIKISPPAIPATTESPGEPASKKPRFFSAIRSPRGGGSTLNRNTPAAIEVELQAYCEEPVQDEEASPLNYWHANKHRFPILAQLARHHLTLPTNTQHIVRLTGLHSSNLGACDTVSSSDFHRMMLIRCNR